MVLLTLLRHAAGFAPPPFEEIRTGETDLNQLVPTEYRADLTLVFLSGRRAVYAKVLEVQLSKDPRKKRTWPLYWAETRARLGCAVGVVVLALDEDVATWAREPIMDGNLGGGQLLPMVLGPRQIPLVTDPEQAQAAPELSMMSLLAHADEPGIVQVADAALQSTLALDGQREKLYYDVIKMALREACRRGLLEKTLMEGLLAKYRDHLKDFHEEEKAEAKAEARAEAKIEDLLEVMAVRGLGPKDEAERRVRSCTDLNRLSLWFRRALRASSLEEVFA